MLPTVHHPETSSYQMYDHFTVDALKTPILPFKSIVIAHIPNERQNTTSGRGFEAMVVGRQSASTGGIQLFNLKTKKFVTRGTFKFLGEHPVKGILFESPIHIEISAGDDTPLTSLAPVPPSTPPIIPYVAIESGEPPVPVTTPAPPSSPVAPPVTQSAPPLAPSHTSEPEYLDAESLHYTMVRQKDVNRKATRNLWSYIGKTIAETDEKGAFECLQKLST